MKRIMTRIVAVIIILLIGVGYKMFTGESGGAKTAEKMMEKLNNGSGATYTETYNTEAVKGEFIYTRDADGNVKIVDNSQDLATNASYESTDYKINDVYYALVDGATYEYDSAELNAIEGYSDIDIEGYFAEQETYVKDVVANMSTGLFDNNIDAEFKKEGDNYVATGVYEGGGDYRVEVAKDGSSITVIDDETTVELKFVDTKVELGK